MERIKDKDSKEQLRDHCSNIYTVLNSKKNEYIVHLKGQTNMSNSQKSRAFKSANILPSSK